MRQQQTVKLFLSATSVRTGKITIFKTNEITAEHVIASDCVPFNRGSSLVCGMKAKDFIVVGRPSLAKITKHPSIVFANYEQRRDSMQSVMQSIQQAYLGTRRAIGTVRLSDGA